jgi:3-carboxy-cis,cis-muconate cycloisomerase
MTETLTTSQLMTPLYASASMRAIMSDRARLQRMLDFEAALARAEAAVGVITATSAAAIGDACDAAIYDIASLVEAQAPSGNITVAVVDALTQQVATRDQAAANFVHWGATSQDVVDTALVLELRAAIDALVADLDAAIKGFTTLAGRHRRTLSVARTMMQHALPVPFGLKLAGYAAALARSRERLARLRREALVLQFGGAAGTLAALGEHGFGVAERMAALLDLTLPDAPWHTHRDRLAEVAACLGILAGTCGKIARDVALMMQTEIGEASERGTPGRGGSSTMPQKRNPVSAAAALSAATVAPNFVATLLAAQVQEHERGLGGSHTEWMTFPALALVTSGALSAVVEIAQGLEIDVERLRTNLELTGGRVMAEAVSFALAEKMGRAQAHVLVQELSQRAAQEKRPLKEILLNDLRVKAQLSGIEIEKLFIPLTYQGSAQTFIDRLVVASQTRAPRRDAPTVTSRLPVPPPPSPAVPIAASHTEMPKGPNVIPPIAPDTNLSSDSPEASSPAASQELKVSVVDRIERPSEPEPKAGQTSGSIMDILTRTEPKPPTAPLDDKRKLS